MIDLKSDLSLATALVGCRFMPGTWDKKFAHSVHSQLAHNMGLTVNQREWLYRLCWKYRKQLRLTDAQASELRKRYEP